MENGHIGVNENIIDLVLVLDFIASSNICGLISNYTEPKFRIISYGFWEETCGQLDDNSLALFFYYDRNA